MIPIGGFGGSVDKSLYMCIPCSNQYIYKSIDITLIGDNRILNGPGHRPQSGQMQDIVYILACLPAGVEIPDVALDKGEVAPLILGDLRANVFKVMLIAGREIVQSSYLMVLFASGLGV